MRLGVGFYLFEEPVLLEAGTSSGERRGAPVAKSSAVREGRAPRSRTKTRNKNR